MSRCASGAAALNEALETIAHDIVAWAQTTMRRDLQDCRKLNAATQTSVARSFRDWPGRRSARFEQRARNPSPA
jgi:hypothetical protein